MNHLRRDTRRERAWKLMRTLGSYTITEVATLAGADVENIRHYHQCLILAGYTKQTGTKRQEGRPGVDKVYRLVKNTGPRPPVQKSLRFLFDPNTSEYWSADPGIVNRESGIVARTTNHERRITNDESRTTNPERRKVRSAEGGGRDEIKKIRIHVRPGSFLDRDREKGGRHVA